MHPTWSDEQKRELLNSYRQTRMAHCPHDNMPLDVTDAQGDDQSAVVFTCPSCGQSFVSSEVK